MGSLALTKTTYPDVWSKRYTQSTSEIFGLPEPDLARKLWREQRGGEDAEVEIPFETAAEKLGWYLGKTYQPVFDALGISSDTEPIGSVSIADRFESALSVLACEKDSEWAKWKVERDEQSDSLSVVPPNKKIVVGMKRSSVEPKQLIGLFGHEVLVHGLRGLNGGKVSKEFGRGLPDYLDSEEGFGVFVEYALTGVIPQKNIDRYIDIAYALGQIDGKEHSRKELINIAMQRAVARNDRAETKKSIEDIEKDVFAHVNRIYRGSLGNEHIGIFTKDISYHKGFVEIGQYIQDQLDVGKTIEEIFTFLSSGKFDPTNQRHLEYLHEHSATN